MLVNSLTYNQFFPIFNELFNFTQREKHWQHKIAAAAIIHNMWLEQSIFLKTLILGTNTLKIRFDLNEQSRASAAGCPYNCC